MPKPLAAAKHSLPLGPSVELPMGGFETCEVWTDLLLQPYVEISMGPRIV